MSRPTIAAQRAYWDDRWVHHAAPNDWQRRRGGALLESIDAINARSSGLRPRILDLGCGTGWFVASLAQRGEALGIDLSSEAIAIARATYPGLEFHACDLFDIDLGAAAFDIIVCQEVIAHVADQSRLIASIARILRPGGHLLITTVNKFVIDRTPQADDPDAHIKQWLDRRALHALLAAQFAVERMFTIIPMGERGVLRWVNSHKLGLVLRALIGGDRLERLKERAGCGYTLVAVARRR